MWNLLWRVLEGGYNITREEADRIHGFLLRLMVVTVSLILVMWGFNAVGMKEVNFIFFFIGGGYIAAKALQPKMIGLAAVAGVVVQGLRDEDLSQGAVKGLQALYMVALGVLLGFWVLSGILSTWSFKEAPAAFFPIAAMVLTLAVMSAYFGLKGKTAVTAITAYAVVVIAIAGWQTIPVSMRPFQGSHAAQQRSAKAIQADRRVTEVVVNWGQNANSKPPINVWSYGYSIPARHDVDLPLGCGKIYQAQYRFYNRVPEWKDYPCDERKLVMASEVRFLLLKEQEGLTFGVLPYR